MATITTTISSIPDAGHRGIDARTEFVTKQEAFQDALTDIFVPQINTFRIEANTLASEVNGLRDGTLTLRNETENIRNLANVQTQEQVALATTQAGIATTKAVEANNSANQALTYKNQLQGYVIPAGTSYSVDQINTQNSAMTKAQFNALAEERKANRAGSGFDEFGAGNSEASKLSINYGMHVWSGAQAKYISLGREADLQGGISKTLYAKLNINGVNIKLGGVAHDGIAVNNNRLDIILPTAPNIYPYDTVLTAEQIASGVIKHADDSNSGLIVNGKFDTDTSGWTLQNGAVYSAGSISATSLVGALDIAYQDIPTVVGKKYIIEFLPTTSTGALGVYISGALQAVYASNGRVAVEFTALSTISRLNVRTAGTTTGTIDNIAVYPADAISRSDLVFLESWHEDISEKNFVYPLGNVQYLGANTDGLTGIANGAFTGFETYSLFGFVN